MSSESQQAEIQQTQSPSTSAPYNQQNAPHDPTDSAIGNSVVRDLMRVYESLTQSSTPQTSLEHGGEPSKPAPGYEHPPPQHPPLQLQQAHHQAPLPPPMQHPTHAIPPPQYFLPPQHSQPMPQYPPPPGQQNGPPPQYHYGEYQQQPQPYVPQEYQQYFVVQPPHHEQQHQVTSHQEHPQIEEEETNESEEPQDPTSLPSNERKRRGSDSSSTKGKGRKKAKGTDGRWSKRFTWPEDLHRDFVSAIFDVGLKHSSPSSILEHMPNHDQITAERIKSHLQKYRMHRIKSKKEFISSYESSIRKFQEHGLAGIKTIASGEVAAHLTYSAVNDFFDKANPAGSSPNVIHKTADSSNAPPAKHNDALVLPQLTEAEKQSPIGASMGYLMGLFFSLKQQLMLQRAKEVGFSEKMPDNAPVQDVFNDGTAQNSAMKPSANIPAHAAPQSARTNIEENSMMKREMQNQMALQNKMRALKQQELDKCKNVNSFHQVVQPFPSEPQSPLLMKDDEEAKAADAANCVHQGAGETAENNDDLHGDNRDRQRGLSFGLSDEFWNTDVVDEQLFEFLMDNIT